MKHLLHTLGVVALLLLPTALFAEEAPPSVHKLVPALEKWGDDPVLIQAVKAQNAEGRSLAEIQRIDGEWQAAEGITGFMQGLMDNAAAKELAGLEKGAPYVTETFLMDNQGANVAMTNKTSDYWQGDEAKFQKSYAGGAGAVHIGPVKFDESAQAYLVQVSVPVKDGGETIGALTIGINLDLLEAP